MKRENELIKNSTCAKLKETLMRNGFEDEWNDIKLVATVSQEAWEKRVRDAMEQKEKRTIEERMKENKIKLGDQMEKVITKIPSFKTYLCNSNRSNGVWLQTRCRSNMLRVLDVVGKQQKPMIWTEEQRQCKLCKSEAETVIHFVTKCEAYKKEREAFIEIVKQRLRDECEDGKEVMRRINWDDSQVIADIAMAMNKVKMKKDTASKLDRAGMNFLSQIWKARMRAL